MRKYQSPKTKAKTYFVEIGIEKNKEILPKKSTIKSYKKLIIKQLIKYLKKNENIQ